MTASSRAERYLPLSYFAVALALVVALLPSVLRPPHQPPTQTAELSPDAPPDDQEQSIISALNRASTGTAGAGEGVGPGVEEGDGPAAGPPARRELSCRGFGAPPRQTESLYSAPCAPPCPTNPGATHKNVFPNEIRIGYRQDIGNIDEGPISDEPESGESGATRTIRVLQRYFNQRFQLCGRTLRIFGLGEGGSSNATAEDARASMAAADEQHRVFASYVLSWDACEDLSRRDLIAFCNPMPRRLFQGHDGKVWSWMTDLTTVDHFAAEFACKQLLGGTADFTDDPVLEGRPRKFGVIYWSAPKAGFRHPDDFAKPFKEQCGGDVAVPIAVGGDVGDVPQAQAAISRLKAEGVTTVILAHETIATGIIMSNATSQQYFPEWVIPTPYAVDFNNYAQLEPREQMRHVLGFSMWELARPAVESDCYTAYRTIDPTGSPDGTVCDLIFPFLLQIVNGLQAAGPNLTTQTFKTGLFSLGHRTYPETWSIGGGYGPGDFTYADDFGLIWWDPAAIDPKGGNPGAYRWVERGKRFRPGEIPTQPLPFFREGVAGPNG